MQKEEILHNFNAKFEESETAWLALLPCIPDAKKKKILRISPKGNNEVGIYIYVLSQKL